MTSTEGHRVAMARRRMEPRIRPLHRGLLVGAAALLAASLSPVGIAARASEEATWTKAASLFDHHAPQIAPTCAGDTLVDGVHVMDCAGLIHSFDGLSLSVVVWMPKEATGPLPTLVYLHGFGSNRGEFSSEVSGHAPPFIAQSLAARGYAVVTPAARGMGGSCGMAPNTGPHDTDGRPQLERPHGGDEDFTCSRGYSHLNDREFETRDVQHLLGLLVESGVADAQRLFATGNSYGAAQTWLLATARPWATPNGAQTIQLAAAVPIAGGTSALNTFAPNGRASDETDGGHSLERPHGVPKLNTILGLATAGRATVGAPRFNDIDPSETHSHGTAWVAFWLKGEPFDTPEGEKLVRMLRERKSAYPPNDYAAALGTGAARPVPVLAVQGWNDALFTPLETLLMYRALKAADPAYPMSMVFADIGHATGRGFGVPDVRAVWTDRAIEFLDGYAFGNGTQRTSKDVVSMSTECAPVFGGDVPASETATAADWDSVHPRMVTLRASGPLVTDSAPPSIDEPTSDPAYPISEGGPAGCITQLAGTYDDTDAITWPVPEGGITLLGLPKLIAAYDLTGEDATVVVKLWDLAPDGTRTLVTRGVYRLALGGGDEPAGVLRTQLFGNHYRFTQGHVIQLDIAQTDMPFLQPDRFRSSIAYSDIKLELPTPGEPRSRIASAAEAQSFRTR